MVSFVVGHHDDECKNGRRDTHGGAKCTVAPAVAAVQG